MSFTAIGPLAVIIHMPNVQIQPDIKSKDFYDENTLLGIYEVNNRVKLCDLPQKDNEPYAWVSTTYTRNISAITQLHHFLNLKLRASQSFASSVLQTSVKYSLKRLCYSKY